MGRDAAAVQAGRGGDSLIGSRVPLRYHPALPSPACASMSRWILYRRDQCSLCERAEEALAAAGHDAIERVVVGWSGELADRYGARIPVLQDRNDGRELDWPFDAWSVQRFIEGV